jgi:transcriptional regulator with XRE-family HTH domain
MARGVAQRFGLICRARRLELDLTQVALSAALGMSRSYYRAIEAGQANPSANLMDRIAETLGLRLDLSASAVVVVTGSRVLGAVHARCSGYVTRRLKSAGWLVLRDVEISDGRMRGWIDVLAFDPRTSTLLVIEIKTSIEDLGRLERQVGWYARAAAASIPADWHATRVVSWVLALASAEVDQVVAQHRDVIDVAFPARASSMRDVLGGSADATFAPGFALIDPRSRRRDWLIATRSDGRRSPAPYQDRAGAGTVLGVQGCRSARWA